MRSWGRRLGGAIAVLTALVSVAPAAAAAGPSVPAKIALPTRSMKAVPYGKSKVLLQGDKGVTRVNLDGSIDRSFGDEGTVSIAARDAAVSPDGKILVASSSGPEGAAESKPRVTCLLPDGRLDPSFGLGGNAEVSFGDDSRGQTIAVAPNGDVLLGGTRRDGPAEEIFSASDIGVARFKPDGSLDGSFGDGGVVISPLGDEIEVMGIAPTPSGGVVYEEGNEEAAYLWKLNRDGSSDRHFGHGGAFFIEGRRGKSGAHQLVLPVPGFVELPSGKIFVAASGLLRSGSLQNLVGRYDADGRVDQSWGRGGWAVLPGHGETSAHGLAALPGGGLAVATTFSGDESRSGRDFGAIALDRRGRPDRGFATHGICRAPLAGAQSAVDVLDVGGRPVVLGKRGATEWLLVCQIGG